MNEVVRLYEDEGRLAIAVGGATVGYSEDDVTDGLFRGDAAALAAGEIDDLPEPSVPVARGSEAASYFPEHDQVQIHRDLSAKAKDYIYGARE